MSARSVHYVCRKHGEFVANVKCGFGHGPAPVQTQCQVPDCYRLADRKAAAKLAQKRNSRKSVSVTAEVYDRLKRYCDANGLSMDQWLDVHTQDMEQ
jgi:hypothetical protein